MSTKLTEKVLDDICSNVPMRVWWGHGAEPVIVLTGTAVLCAYGLMDEFNDVDLIVRADNSYWSDLLEQYNISIGEAEYENIKIENGGFTYNIIREDTYREKTIISYDDLKFDTFLNGFHSGFDSRIRSSNLIPVVN